MDVTPDLVREELGRIKDSARFREAPGQVRLLEFVVTRELEGRGAELKESTIAMDVFGRGGEFDGRLDNLVRVNASRLRAKLAAYYAEEGKSSGVMIEIPRGSYVPRWGARGEAAKAAQVHGKGWVWWAVGVAVLVALVGGLSYRAGLDRGTPQLSRGLRELYGRLWEKPVVLVYRVPVFLRYEKKFPALLLYNGHVTAQTYEVFPLPSDADAEVRKQIGERTVRFENTWTDVGTAHGVYGITNIFGRAGKDLTMGDTLTMTADHCRNKNMIVVSTPWFNTLVGQLPELRHFEFDRTDSQIRGKRPRNGKREVYVSLHDSQTMAMRATFGFVSLGPGIWPGTKVLRISGLDPIGVQGAASFITTETGVEELEHALGGRDADEFEAVLAVHCLKGQVSSVTVQSAYGGK